MPCILVSQYHVEFTGLATGSLLALRAACLGSQSKAFFFLRHHTISFPLRGECSCREAPDDCLTVCSHMIDTSAIMFTNTDAEFAQCALPFVVLSDSPWAFLICNSGLEEGRGRIYSFATFFSRVKHGTPYKREHGGRESYEYWNQRWSHLLH